MRHHAANVPLLLIVLGTLLLSGCVGRPAAKPDRTEAPRQVIPTPKAEPGSESPQDDTASILGKASGKLEQTRSHLRFTLLPAMERLDRERESVRQRLVDLGVRSSADLREDDRAQRIAVELAEVVALLETLNQRRVACGKRLFDLESLVRRLEYRQVVEQAGIADGDLRDIVAVIASAEAHLEQLPGRTDGLTFLEIETLVDRELQAVPAGSSPAALSPGPPPNCAQTPDGPDGLPEARLEAPQPPQSQPTSPAGSRPLLVVTQGLYTSYVQLGDSYREAGDPNAAAEIFAKASRLRPDDPYAKDRLADCRCRIAVAKGDKAYLKGDYRWAIDCYTEALSYREDAGIRAKSNLIQNLLRQQEKLAQIKPSASDNPHAADRASAPPNDAARAGAVPASTGTALPAESQTNPAAAVGVAVKRAVTEAHVDLMAASRASGQALVQRRQETPSANIVVRQASPLAEFQTAVPVRDRRSEEVSGSDTPWLPTPYADHPAQHRRTGSFLQTAVAPSYRRRTSVYKGRSSGTPDLETKTAWVRKAAEAGNLDAMTVLGCLYERGRGVAGSPARALAWYQRAADMGYVPAMIALGRLYSSGNQEAGPDFSQAFRWMEIAAKTDDLEAMVTLGTWYLEGVGGRDYEGRGRQWLRRAARLGDDSAARTIEMLDARDKMEAHERWAAHVKRLRRLGRR